MTTTLFQPCSNCNEGQCMDCIMRHVHDECYESPCPFCDGRGFVPVAKCEHGRYDPHRYRISRALVDGGVMRNCAGAGLGEKEQ